jgi:hypothetical protein
MTRQEQIKKAAWLFDPDDMESNYQIFIDGAEWADNNRQDVSQLIIDLIHQQSEKLAIAIKALEENANEDYRGNRSSESVRSFNALKKIKELENGK